MRCTVVKRVGSLPVSSDTPAVVALTALKVHLWAEHFSHRPPPFDFAVVLSDERARMEQTNGIYGNSQSQRICSQCMLSIEIIATTWRCDSSLHLPTGQLSVTRARVHTHVLNLLRIVFVHRKRRKNTVHITL